MAGCGFFVMAGFVSLKLKYTNKTMEEWETIVILEKQLLKKSKKTIILKGLCYIGCVYPIMEENLQFRKFMKLTK
ncbi:hypothetical protein LQK80_03740 [Bacillus thuringiensis]|nr:hypothetical protein [Bacillus thuringiensis]